MSKIGRFLGNSEEYKTIIDDKEVIIKITPLKVKDSEKLKTEIGLKELMADFFKTSGHEVTVEDIQNMSMKDYNEMLEVFWKVNGVAEEVKNAKEKFIADQSKQISK